MRYGMDKIVDGPMKLSNQEHAALPWRMGEIAPDFKLLDAWALPATGRRDEFEDLQALFIGLDPADDRGSILSRFLFATRDRLGRWFGWDEQAKDLPIPGCTETSLRERLPADLPPLDGVALTRFRPVFGTDTEWVAELSNATVHAALQLGWVAEDGAHYRGRLGVYVKPRGRFGGLYLAAIAPFRHVVVYPALMRRIGRAWESR